MTFLQYICLSFRLGIGNPRKVDRVETQKISRSEGKHINSNANGNGNDWDAAWSDDEQDDSSLQGKTKSVDHASDNSLDSWQDSNVSNGNQDDDTAEAWGWGDDDATDSENPTTGDGTTLEGAEALVQENQSDAVREVTLTEKYTISSMPDPVFNTIKSIIEDGVTLTREM